MKKILKITGITIVSVILLLYLVFLFVIPNVVNLNNYKADLQKLVKEQTNLIVDYQNAKISVTPLLSAGIKTDRVNVKFSDNSDFFNADSFVGRISLPHLLFLKLKVSKAEIINPVINVDIVNGANYKIVQELEKISNQQITKEQTVSESNDFDISKIEIVVPEVKITNYLLKINDLKTRDYLKLRGDELILSYTDGKKASIKTVAELYLNEIKNINANLDIDTYIPEFTSDASEDTNTSKQSQPAFINPVAIYKAYNLKTNIDSKIKIKEKNNLIVSKGYVNVDNFTVNLAGTQLPESKLHLTTKGSNVDIDSDLYVAKDEKIAVDASLQYGKKQSFDIKIDSDKIHINNLLNLIGATLTSANVQNDIVNYKGEGYFTANAKLKTDFKKLQSDGKITIKDCIIRDLKNKTELFKANSIISLDNSILKFIDTVIIIADTKFEINGTIDEKSNADLAFEMEKMPLARLFSMFAPAEINEAYVVNSGNVNLAAYIKGELKNATANLKLALSNISLTDKVNKINYIDSLLVADFNSDFKTYNGKVTNTDFKLLMDGITLNSDRVVMNVNEKDINIDSSKLQINNSSEINFSGKISDYVKNPEISIKANGNLATKDLKQILGPDMAMYIKDKGSLPVNIDVAGDMKKQVVTASISADKNNYITPIHIRNVENQNTVVKTVLELNGDTLKIKDTGFYLKNFGNESSLKEILSVDGSITKLYSDNPNINQIKVKMPSEITANICVFPKSSLKAKTSMFIYGDLNAPKIRGSLDAWDIAIPELMLTSSKLSANIEDNDLDIDIKNVNANGSDYNILINADLSQSDYFLIKTMNIISNLTDADKVMLVSDAAMKYVPQSSGTTASSVKNNSTSNVQPQIPVVVKDGSIDIKQIKSGTITLTDTTGRISLSKDILYITNLLTSAFDGKIKGDVSTNLTTGEIKAALKGSGLDVEKTLLDAAAMKDTLTGTMDFDTDISLKGATYEEQMKSLAGKVSFTMKNGSLGPFGKIENLIMAENIRKNAFFSTSVGSIINSLLTIDTSHYNTLNGNLTFNNGVAAINPITSSGDVMSTYIFGNFGLLTNQIDIKLRGRLGSQVSESMGTLSLLNPVNFVKANTSLSKVVGKFLTVFTEVVTEAELAQIPALDKTISDTNTTRFQAIIKGNVEKPLNTVKSFKWLALESELKEAQEAVGGTSEVDTIINTITTIKKDNVKDTAKEAAKQIVGEDTVKAVESTKQTVKQVKDALTTNKEETKNAVKEQAKNTLKGLFNTLTTTDYSSASTSQ